MRAYEIHPARCNLTSVAQTLSSKTNAEKRLLSYLKKKERKKNESSRSSTTRFIFPISKANWRGPCICQNTNPIYRRRDCFFWLFGEVTWVTHLALPVPQALYLSLSKAVKQNVTVRGMGEPSPSPGERWNERLSNTVQSISRKTFS